MTLFAYDFIENYIRIKAQSYDLSNNSHPAPSAEGHRLYRLCEALFKVNFPYYLWKKGAIYLKDYLVWNTLFFIMPDYLS